ncbi:MAG: DUF4476 domain-containing protein [Bacteroidetes bacterium]|nr:DUF4476 domain-containing protein [Bacteroidota bacterium]
MKKYLFLLLFAGTSLSQLIAQKSNIVVFSENGEKFSLFVNGQSYSAAPLSNFKIDNLDPLIYQIRVVFEDPALGELKDKIDVRPGKEITYSVKKRKISDAEKRVKIIGQNFKDKPISETEKKKEEIRAEESKYVVRWLSDKDLMPATPPQQPQQQAAPVQKTAVSTTQTTTYSQSTTTKSNTRSSSGVNSNTSTDGVNVSMNININDGMGAPVQQSSTTTTSQTTTIVYVDGYNGPVGCPRPMSREDFASAKQSISSKNFEDSKFTMAKQIIQSNCLVASQVKEIMLLFNFEQTRLDFAKFAYAYTYDTGNYYKLNDAFTFEASISELDAYINGR